MSTMPAERQIVFIHILRGIAPLLVLWAHVPGWWLVERGLAWPPFEWFGALVVRPLHLFHNGGHFGVVLFFLISGFIISHVASREERLDFAVKRAFRLFPVIIVCVGLMATAAAISGHHGWGPILGNTARNGTDYLRTILFLDWFAPPPAPPETSWLNRAPGALSVTWTLVPELLFYASMLVVMRLQRSRPVRATLVLMGIHLALSLPFALVPYLNYLAYFTVFLPMLIIGRVFWMQWSGLIDGRVTAVLLAANALVFVAIHTARFPGQMMLAGIEPAYTYAGAVILFYGLMLAAPRHCPGPLSFLAAISYSLYLVHMPVGMLVLNGLHAVPMSFSLKVLAALAGSILAAAALHHVVERPFQRLARRLLRKRGHGGWVRAA